MAESEDLELSLGYYRGPLPCVLEAISRARLRDAVLELDGSPSEELFDLAEELSAHDPELRQRNHRARHGGWQLAWFRFGGGPLYIPLSDEALARLHEMTARHADPEIAIHLRVLAGEETLVDAPDVGDNEIWVSHHLSADAIDAMRTALGDGLDQPR